MYYFIDLRQSKIITFIRVDKKQVETSNIQEI